MNQAPNHFTWSSTKFSKLVIRQKAPNQGHVPFFSVKKENITLPPPLRKNRYGDRLNLLRKMETGHSNPHAHHHTRRDVAILDGGFIAWMASARMVEMSLGDTMAGGMRGGRTRLLKSIIITIIIVFLLPRPSHASSYEHD